jgi:hypothetical protein
MRNREKNSWKEKGNQMTPYDAEIDRQVAGIADMMGLPFDHSWDEFDSLINRLEWQLDCMYFTSWYELGNELV